MTSPSCDLTISHGLVLISLHLEFSLTVLCHTVPVLVSPLAYAAAGRPGGRTQRLPQPHGYNGRCPDATNGDNQPQWNHSHPHYTNHAHHVLVR